MSFLNPSLHSPFCRKLLEGEETRIGTGITYPSPAMSGVAGQGYSYQTRVYTSSGKGSKKEGKDEEQQQQNKSAAKVSQREVYEETVVTTKKMEKKKKKKKKKKNRDNIVFKVFLWSFSEGGLSPESHIYRLHERVVVSMKDVKLVKELCCEVDV